jgi:hypothetical protein
MPYCGNCREITDHYIGNCPKPPKTFRAAILQAFPNTPHSEDDLMKELRGVTQSKRERGVKASTGECGSPGVGSIPTAHPTHTERMSKKLHAETDRLIDKANAR